VRRKAIVAGPCSVREGVRGVWGLCDGSRSHCLVVVFACWDFGIRLGRNRKLFANRLSRAIRHLRQSGRCCPHPKSCSENESRSVTARPRLTRRAFSPGTRKRDIPSRRTRKSEDSTISRLPKSYKNRLLYPFPGLDGLEAGPLWRFCLRKPGEPGALKANQFALASLPLLPQ
jgi:hypothetical protein